MTIVPRPLWMEARDDKNSDASGGSTTEPIDLTRFAVGVIALTLLLVGVLGVLAGSDALKGVGLTLFAGLGFGTALLQRNREITGTRFLCYGLATSTVGILLIGFLLVELRLWSAGTAVFAVCAVLAAILHGFGVRRHMPSFLGFVNADGTAPNSGSQNRRALAALVGGACCLVSAALNQHLNPGLGGILGSIGPIWYVGLVIIVSTIVLGRGRPSELAIPVVVLIVVLTVTPALVFDLPLFPWTAKHVGVTNFFIAHGSVSTQAGSVVTIYQSWPALFAGVAWLCHACHVTNPMEIARWWPPFIDLSSVIAFRYLADRVGLSAQHAWTAAAMFFLANAIGQDYYSPQSVSYFLALVIFSISFRRREQGQTILPFEWGLLVVTSCVLAVTHQLTPFMVTAALVVMVLFGYVGSLWMPIIALVPALIWTGIHFSSVSRYLNIDQFGNLAANVASPGAAHPELHNDLLVHLSVAGQLVAMLLVAILALAVVLRWRTRLHWMLACSAASGGGLLFASSYGNEGIFRVGLFAIPWLALLAADGQWTPQSLMSAASLAVVPISLVAYLFGDMGLDFGYDIRAGDVAVINVFERTGNTGAVLFSMGYGSVPILSTGITDKHTYYEYEDIPSHAEQNGVFNPTSSVKRLTTFLEFSKSGPGATAASRRAQYFAVTTTEAAAESEMRGLFTATQYQEFRSALALSPDWKVVARSSSATLYLFTFHGVNHG